MIWLFHADVYVPYAKVVELEALPQSDEELDAFKKSLPADEGPIRRILVISPLS